MRRVRLCLLLTAVALIATACFRSDLAIEVNDDGSGTFTQVIAVNPKVMGQFAGQLGETTEETVPTDMCEEMVADAGSQSSQLPKGAKVEPYKDGDFCGVKLTVEFSNPDQLQDIFDDVTSQTEGEGFGSLQSLSIERDGDGWKFEAKPSSSDSTGAGGDMGMFGDMMKGASNVVRVKLPGRQVDYNADRIDKDGTLIWNLDVTGDTRTLTARTEKGAPKTNENITDAGKDVAGEIGGAVGSSDDGGSNVLWIVLGVAVVAAAIIGFILFKRKKATPSAVTAGGGAAEAVTSTFDSPAAPASPAASNGGPQWDAQRNAYIQWDAASNRWMQFDDTTKEWKPIS